MTTTTGYATNYIQFSRASLATVTDADGKVKWAAHNLLQMSEQLDGTAWAKGNSTITANSTVAPNGTTTADTMTGTGSSPAVYQSYSAIVGTLTYAIYLKAGTLSTANLRLSQAAVGYEATFTLTGSGIAGTPTIVGTGGTVSNVTSNISALDNGWYRCALTFSETGSGNVMVILNATSGTVYLWGAHLYRSDLGGMVANTSAYPMYNPTTPKNLLGYTESFDNAAWTKGQATVTANSIVAPNGLQTGDTITEDTSTNTHYVSQSITVPAGRETISVYAKQGSGSRYLQIRPLGLGVGILYATFNLTAGTVAASGGTALVSTSITDAGNGWYRCAVTANFASSATGIMYALTDVTTEFPSYTGNGTSSIYLWGAQSSDSASLDTYTRNNFAAPSAAAYYGPRLDYSASGSALGLLVEEQRTNLLLYSEQIDNLYWFASSSGTGVVPTVTANAGISPSGQTSADRVQMSLGGGTTVSDHSTIRSGTTTITNGVAYTYSVWLKSYDGATYTVLARDDTGSGATSVLWTVTSAWQRFSYTATSSSTSSGGLKLWLRGTVGTSATADLLMYGAQMELGSFATSYIPTTSASVTRSADVAQIGTAAFPYSDTAGSFVVAFRTADAANSVLGDQTASTALLYSNANDMNTTNGTSGLTASGAWSLNAVVKAGVVYDATGRGICLNGGAVGTVSGLLQTVTSIQPGRGIGNSALNGHIRQITYIPRRLSNAELQSRTA